MPDYAFVHAVPVAVARKGLQPGRCNRDALARKRGDAGCDERNRKANQIPLRFAGEHRPEPPGELEVREPAPARSAGADDCQDRHRMADQGSEHFPFRKETRGACYGNRQSQRCGRHARGRRFGCGPGNQRRCEHGSRRLFLAACTPPRPTETAGNQLPGL